MGGPHCLSATATVGNSVFPVWFRPHFWPMASEDLDINTILSHQKDYIKPGYNTLQPSRIEEPIRNEEGPRLKEQSTMEGETVLIAIGYRRRSTDMGSGP